MQSKHHYTQNKNKLLYTHTHIHLNDAFIHETYLNLRSQSPCIPWLINQNCSEVDTLPGATKFCHKGRFPKLPQAVSTRSRQFLRADTILHSCLCTLPLTPRLLWWGHAGMGFLQERLPAAKDWFKMLRAHVLKCVLLWWVQANSANTVPFRMESLLLATALL